MNLWKCNMTTKQITTLVLFSQNYSLVVIAKKMGVCLTTIRERLKALAKNHQKEFNNALGMRESCKRNRDAIKNPIVFSNSLLQTLEIIEKF